MNSYNTKSVSSVSVGYTLLNSMKALESNSVESVGHLPPTTVLVSKLGSSQSQPQAAILNTSCEGGSYQNTIKQEYPAGGPKSSNLANKHDLVISSRDPPAMLRWRNSVVCSSQQPVETVNTSSSSLPKKQSSGLSREMIRGSTPDVQSSGQHENIIVAQRRCDSRAVLPDSKTAKLQHGPSRMASEQTAQTTSSQYYHNCSGVKQSHSADSSAHKSPTNSIEWQNYAFKKLQMLKEKYRQVLYNLLYKTKERCLKASSSAEEYSKLEKALRVFEWMYAFLSMSKDLLANYPKENFVHNAKHIIGSLSDPRIILASATQSCPVSQASNHLNPSTQQQPGEGIKVNTSRQEVSGSTHVVSGQCQNTSGFQLTENKPPMENMSIRPIFDAQSNGQQEAVSLLPQPSRMDPYSTQWKGDLSSRNTESASSSVMSANPITSLSPSIGKEKKRQMIKPPKVMPHPIITNNPERISAQGTKRSNSERAEDSLMRQNHPVGQIRQSSPSSQGGLANCNVSSVSASLNHPQHMNPNGSSRQSQTSASLASVPSSPPPCLFATSISHGQYHVNSSSPESQHAHTKNTVGIRDASHQNADIHETEVEPCLASVAKRQKTEVAELVFQEIRSINRRLIETVVDMKDLMTEAMLIDGVILQFTFSAVGQKRSPNLVHNPLMFPDLLLQVVVSADYPNVSPCIVDRHPQPWSGNGIDLWNETRQKFDRAVVRKNVQPISLTEMAKAWDMSAHEACREYAHMQGGGSFSSKYGTWEKCIAL